MGESKNIKLLLQSHPAAKPFGKLVRGHHGWMIVEDDKQDLSNMSSASSSFDSSGTSTSASSDLADDASSSPSSSHLSVGPLYNLSDLMTHLPIKRGLSKHYNGKSQSFTSLSKVVSVEDLAKKERFCRRKTNRACESLAAGLDHKLSPTSPKPAICKKSSRNTHVSFVCHPTQDLVAALALSRRLILAKLTFNVEAMQGHLEKKREKISCIVAKSYGSCPLSQFCSFTSMSQLFGLGKDH